MRSSVIVGTVYPEVVALAPKPFLEMYWYWLQQFDNDHGDYYRDYDHEYHDDGDIYNADNNANGDTCIPKPQNSPAGASHT